MTNFNNKTLTVIFLLIIILIIIHLINNNEYFDSEQEASNSLCKVAFDNYNLYPSSNPLVIKGNDINWNLNNNITDYNALYNMGTKYYPVINNIIPDYNPADTDSTKKAFNTLLQQAPTKVGCCFRNKSDNGRRTVLVRTPLNPSDTDIDPILKKFDFNFKSLNIPEGTCPVDYYAGSPDCDAFYDVYCTNVLNEFKKQNLSPEDFVKYAPECSCYAPRTSEQQIYPVNTPPACFKTNCDNVFNPTTYIDPISRAHPCDITVCQNIFNATVGNVTGNVNINAKLENSCGQFLPPEDTKNTNTNNTTTGETGSNTSGE